MKPRLGPRVNWSSTAVPLRTVCIHRMNPEKIPRVLDKLYKQMNALQIEEKEMTHRHRGNGDVQGDRLSRQRVVVDWWCSAVS